MKEIIKNIMNSNIKGLDPQESFRVAICNIFLLASGLVMLWALIYRIYNGSETVFILIDIGTSCSFLGAFVWMRIRKEFNKVINFGTFIIVSFMIVFIYVNRNNESGLFWSFMVPPFVILLNGYKKGLIWMFFYYLAIFLTMFMNYPLWQEEGWTKLSLVRYGTTSFGLVFLTAMGHYLFNSLSKKLNLLSTTDVLTSINNRRRCDEKLDENLELLKRFGGEENKNDLSFCILDLDNFKKINDTYGHSVGDEVLIKMGKILRNTIRVTDMAGRWGGEEFCIIMPKTNAINAMSLLQRIQRNMRECDFGIVGKVTCSFGLYSTVDKLISKEKLINRADSALYEAKNKGKNRICVYKLEEEE